MLIFSILGLALAIGLSVGISNNNNYAALVAANTSQTQALFMLQSQLASLVAGLITNGSGVNVILTDIESGPMTWALYDGSYSSFSPLFSTVMTSAPGTYQLQNVQIGSVNFTQLILSPPSPALSVPPGTTTQFDISVVAYGFNLPETVSLSLAVTAVPLTLANQAAIEFSPPCANLPGTCTQQVPGNTIGSVSQTRSVSRYLTGLRPVKYRSAFDSPIETLRLRFLNAPSGI